MEKETLTNTFDLCIVGAGLAGLNALYVASEYLDKSAKIAVVDKRPEIGGMWNSTYKHVRLHQPHRLFTAGNIPWQLKQRAGYLASRTEILEHFQTCWEELSQKLNITHFPSYELEEVKEVPAEKGGYQAHARFKALTPSQPDLMIRTPRCIKATGFSVEPNDPMTFSSQQVRSISPESADFLGDEMRQDGKPVYVVGGGKTGTDAAHELVSELPGRRVELFIGGGTAFFDRSEVFPEGMKRYYGGTLILDVLRNVALAYNGKNDEEAFNHFVTEYGLKLDAGAVRSLYGVISSEEIDTINKGAADIHNHYIQNVVDKDGEPVLVLRNGEERPIEKGSWIVNCSGHLLKKPKVHEPFLSEHKTTISIQQTSGLFFVTSFGAYFLTHLWFLNKLPEVQLYAINHDALHQKSREAYFMVAATQVLYNLMLIMDNVPFSVIKKCGINFDYWYPLYRVLYLVGKLKANKKKYLAHFKNTLDTVEERFGINGGSLPR